MNGLQGGLQIQQIPVIQNGSKLPKWPIMARRRYKVIENGPKWKVANNCQKKRQCQQCQIKSSLTQAPAPSVRKGFLFYLLNSANLRKILKVPQNTTKLLFYKCLLLFCAGKVKTRHFGFLITRVITIITNQNQGLKRSLVFMF